MNPFFIEATWGQVQKGDTVLQICLDEILKAEILTIEPREGIDGRKLLRVELLFVGIHLNMGFDPAAVVYVKSRL